MSIKAVGQSKIYAKVLITIMTFVRYQWTLSHFSIPSVLLQLSSALLVMYHLQMVWIFKNHFSLSEVGITQHPSGNSQVYM